MTFTSVHKMLGDPDDLLARKREHMDPVVERLAPAHGAILSITAKSEDGIVTVNVWETAEGAAAFTRDAEALAAQRTSGLPMPASFERYDEAEYVLYDRP
jgi:hypothetical protein